MALSVDNLGFLRFCLFGGQEKGLEIKEEANIRCDIGSKGDVEIKERATIAGNILGLGQKVQVEPRARVFGNIRAEGDVELKEGTLVQGDVVSGGDLVLKKEARVEGNVTAAGKVQLEAGAVVTGTIQQRATVPPVSPITPVVFTLTAGKKDIRVEAKDTLTLEPGIYGELEVKERAVLTLRSGRYAFQEFQVGQGATVNLDLSGGHIIIDVVEKLELKEGVGMVVVSATGSAADVMFRVQEKVELKEGGKYLGTYLGVGAQIEVSQGSSLEGALYGAKVAAKEGSSIIGEPALGVFASLSIP